MSDLIIILATGSFTLAAGVLGSLSAGHHQERARKAAARAAHDRAVSETIAAGDDLLAAVRLFRNVWRLPKVKALAAGIDAGWTRPAATSLAGLLPAALQDVAAAIIDGGIADRMFDRSGDRYLQVVVPARQRLSVAVAPHRISPDERLAQAADLLAQAASMLADKASSKARVFRRAENAYERCLRDFRVAGTRPRSSP